MGEQGGGVMKGARERERGERKGVLESGDRKMNRGFTAPRTLRPKFASLASDGHPSEEK